MPRRPKLQITATDKGHKLDVPASLSATGRRERYFYDDENAAKKHAAALRKQYHERGTKAGVICPSLAVDAMKALEMLKPFNVPLLTVIQDYVTRNTAKGSRVTLDAAWASYIAALIKNKRADATVADYKRDRKSLPEWLFKKTIGDITEDLIEKALDECTCNRGKTWNRKLRELRAVMNEATRTKVKQAETKQKDPEILTAKQSAAAMAAAVEEGCALPHALMLFAGIRPEGELSRITWGSIKTDYIDISSEESKTSDDRHIPISPNLRRWIDACDGDDIIPGGWEQKKRAVRKAAGVSGQDPFRHTFGSMFYRLHTESETIKAMGHTSFKTTEKFYKRAVIKQEAEAFFAIYPDDGIIHQLASA